MTLEELPNSGTVVLPCVVAFDKAHGDFPVVVFHIRAGGVTYTTGLLQGVEAQAFLRRAAQEAHPQAVKAAEP